MNKQQVYMGKMIGLLLQTFTIGLLVGEELRDLLCGEQIQENEQVDDQERIPGSPFLRRWDLLSLRPSWVVEFPRFDL